MGYEQNERIRIELYRPARELDHNLLAGGSHDLVLDLLATALRERGSGFTLSSAHLGSMGGILAIDKGQAHLAGCLLYTSVPYTSQNLESGRIRDCNTPALTYLGRRSGAEVVSGGILPDIFDHFLEKSRNLLNRVDFLVLSGGSSVGARDFTARTLQELGKPGLLVEGISIKPGKPTLLANCNGKPVLGLPGHPISALNVFLIFGVAILNRCLLYTSRCV